MSSKRHKTILYFKRFLLFFTVLVVALFIVAFFFRNSLLQKAIVKTQHSFKQDFHSDLVIHEASFEGFSTVLLSKVTIVPNDADTLLSVEKIKININFLPLLKGELQLEKLELKNGFLQLIKNKKGRNFDAFFNRQKQEDSENKNYAELAYDLLTKVLNLIPTDMRLENVSLRLDDMGRKVTLLMPQLTLKNKELETSIYIKTNTFAQNWKLKGFADPRDKIVNLKLYTTDTTKVKVPYIDERFNLLSSFDSLAIQLDKIEMESGDLHIDGSTSIVNLTLNHKRIARKDVVFQKTRFDFNLLLGSDFISIDSSSTAQINDIKINPFAEYNTEKDPIYKLQIKIPKMSAQDFISSLPHGLFSHFEGMKVSGNFDYALNFKFNKNKPSQLVFNSNLKKENLRILKYGEANLGKLNSEFTYHAIDNGKAQRAVYVGLSNLNYTPIGQISPYLQKCVLTSEDPSFFRHRGFINQAFKQSILKNIRTNKFSRGASTISMQLVKNVFLTREKTLSRKLEEILLVYILENNRIASKERMLEVYFNVIEWGPNVYGIGEAARFYFQKSPINLNLKECLFLATIIPKPKKFMWLFDNQGSLKSYANQHQQFLSNLMLRRGLLSSLDTIGQKRPLFVSGRARSFLNIQVADSIAKDSIPITVDEFNF
jgi:Transglycosylase/AsmA family